jgi:hypothetical protein
MLVFNRAIIPSRNNRHQQAHDVRFKKKVNPRRSHQDIGLARNDTSGCALGQKWVCNSRFSNVFHVKIDQKRVCFWKSVCAKHTLHPWPWQAHCHEAVTYIYIFCFSQETQRNGLVFVYDMTNSKYTNFDYDLSIKILSMLKVREFSECWKLFYFNSLSYYIKIMLLKSS